MSRPSYFALGLCMIFLLSSSRSRAADDVQQQSRFVSADQYSSLQEAVEKEDRLYIPAGKYDVETPIQIRGRRDVIIVGSGRFSTQLTTSFVSSIFEIHDCQNVVIANLTAEQRNAEVGLPTILVTGTKSGEVAFAGITVQARANAGRRGNDWQNSGIGIQFSGPGKYTIQGCHFNLCGIGVEVAHPSATLSMMGGNFQSNRIHIRQVSGRLAARCIGFQIAAGGTDIEFQSAASDGSDHLVEGCRTEGPGCFARVDDTPSKVNLTLKANNVLGTYLADFGGTGTLVLSGNTLGRYPNSDSHLNRIKASSSDPDATEADLQDLKSSQRSAVRCRGKSGPCQVFSYGNHLGNNFDDPGSFVLGGGSTAVSTGDQWNAMPPGGKFVPRSTRILSVDAFNAAGRSVPNGLQFTSQQIQNDALSSSPAYHPIQFPRVSNIGEFVTSVKKYGAVGDGQTDDSQAIASALEAERHKPLYFPAGRYRVDQPVILQHWRGATFWGEGHDRSVIVGSELGAMGTNGCGFATFVDLGFEVPVGAKGIAFDSNWDNTNVADSGGGALQANMFYRCRFQGGNIALAIGRGGYMGSEHLMASCLFRQSITGMLSGNYNSLSNTVIGGKFEDVDTVVDQKAGAFCLYGTTLRNVRKYAILIINSVRDTFVFNRIRFVGKDSGAFLATTHSGAVFNILLEDCVFERHTEADKIKLIKDIGGGSLTLLDCDLSNRSVEKGGDIDYSTLLLIDTQMDNPKQVQATGHAKGFSHGSDSK